MWVEVVAFTRWVSDLGASVEAHLVAETGVPVSGRSQYLVELRLTTTSGVPVFCRSQVRQLLKPWVAFAIDGVSHGASRC